MFILGLTGSIAMGKSTASRALRSLGVPVFDADAAVHRLLAPGGGAVAAIRRAFPDCLSADGGVDRQALGGRVFDDPAALARLEAILHPMVQLAQRRFLARCAGARRPLVVLDVPLLYETGGERRVDAVAVVSAPPLVQAQRLRRAGHVAGTAGGDPRAPDAGCREAATRGFRDPDRSRATALAPRGRADRRPPAPPSGRRRPRAWPR